MGATYPGELARSEQQVTYYKRHGGGSSSSEANDLYTIMLNAQLEDTNKKRCKSLSRTSSSSGI